MPRHAQERTDAGLCMCAGSRQVSSRAATSIAVLGNAGASAMSALSSASSAGPAIRATDDAGRSAKPAPRGSARAPDSACAPIQGWTRRRQRVRDVRGIKSELGGRRPSAACALPGRALRGVREPQSSEPAHPGGPRRGRSLERAHMLLRASRAGGRSARPVDLKGRTCCFEPADQTGRAPRSVDLKRRTWCFDPAERAAGQRGRRLERAYMMLRASRPDRAGPGRGPST